MLTKDNFVEIATNRHGGKYTYEAAIYRNRRDKVDITCPKHGVFKQSPAAHVRGNGCPECAKRRFDTIRKTSESFISEILSLHGNSRRYDFSKLVYINNSTPVIVGCPEHGEFATTPSKLLCGRGCQTCAEESRGKRRVISLDRVIARAHTIHGYRYDYSAIKETTYIGMRGTVSIKCTVHNKTFKMTMNRHVNCKDGCPICKKEKRDIRKANLAW